MKLRQTLSMLLALTLTVGVLPALAQGETMAYARTQTILLDGEPAQLQAYALKDEQGYETNYVKLRDVAWLLNGTPAQFQVSWDGAVNVITGQSYTPDGTEMSTPFTGDRAYALASAPTKVDGAESGLEAILLTDDAGSGYTYYKLRDLGEALGFAVDWSAETGVTIDTGAGAPAEPVAVPDGEYDEQAFELLYFTPPQRLSQFEAFTGQVTQETLSGRAKELLEKCRDKQITMHKRLVGEVPIYECYRDDGTVKPVVFLLHGGGGSKEDNLDNLMLLAQDGFYVVALDAAASGESDRGPLVSLVAIAETVKYIDTLMEYCNTVEQADPANAAIIGGSLGGNIAYCYGAYGKYTLTAIFACIATPDLTSIGDRALFDCFDHGQQHVPTPWTEEQIRTFAQRYSPILHPERFLDTYLFAGNGALDGSASPEGPQALEAALTQLGGENFLFYVDPDRGHERLPAYYEALFPALRQIMLEGTIPQASELGLS